MCIYVYMYLLIWNESANRGSSILLHNVSWQVTTNLQIKQMTACKKLWITQDKSSGPKGKFCHKLQQQRVLVQAAREELVPGIDGGLLRLVHQDVFFLQTQAAGVVACLEGGAVGQDPPLDGDVVVEDPLVLEGPDVAGQLGVLPLLCVST